MPSSKTMLIRLILPDTDLQPDICLKKIFELYTYR